MISIHISAGLSGTAGSATQAAEQLARDGRGGERVRVVDSETAAGGLGMLVLTAARAAASGGEPRRGRGSGRAPRAPTSRCGSPIDTLEFLKRGGRIGAASAWIGSTLKVKPILTVESEMTPVERVRTSARAFERMVDYARQRHESGADAWVVQHISAPDQAELLAERCREVFGCEPLFVSEIGPVAERAHRSRAARRGLDPRAPAHLAGHNARRLRRPAPRRECRRDGLERDPGHPHRRPHGPDHGGRRAGPLHHLPVAPAASGGCSSPPSWRSRSPGR